MDDLASIPKPASAKRILLCSQPLEIPSWSRPHVAEWRRFIDDVLSEVPDGIELRVRLHPAEIDTNYTDNVRRSLQPGRSLLEDLEWASVVAAPFSTTLLEAAAAGRGCVLLVRDDAMLQEVSGWAFFNDGGLARSYWDTSSFFSVSENSQLSTDPTLFLSNLGGSAVECARAIGDLARSRS